MYALFFSVRPRTITYELDPISGPNKMRAREQPYALSPCLNGNVTTTVVPSS